MENLGVESKPLDLDLAEMLWGDLKWTLHPRNL